jgi:hypothetical protein
MLEALHILLVVKASIEGQKFEFSFPPTDDLNHVDHRVLFIGRSLNNPNTNPTNKHVLRCATSKTAITRSECSIQNYSLAQGAEVLPSGS